MNNSSLPLISIALCPYNGCKYLRPQLDSLVNQTYPNLEISVYDDCSTDETPSIIQEYAKEFPQIKVHQNSRNLGYQENFSANFKACKGVLIAPSDQDDIWALDKIEKLYQILKDHILVYHDSELIDEKGKSKGIKMSTKLNFVSGMNPKSFLFFNCVSGHSMLFRKDLLDHIFPFPKKGFYDHWIAFVASHYGSIDYHQECLVKYRQHQHNLTDILGSKSKETKLQVTCSRIQRENDWLEICAAYEKQISGPGFANNLYAQGKNRDSNYFNFRFGYTIWKYQNDLLHIPRQKPKRRLGFAIRQIWGLKTKTLFK
ncbi:glycosyltransferase [Algoriphagus halophytocola]|uniref:Glycosyltransferase n=1 Tax=Algoriphagus halophytocola TaxID=2991499 RepID=A0ABY6MGG9_9BACT|nr:MULTISPECIES: glycosyltransferase [unclassified Algoriphagus]UZD22898.1 glycosyltransferase [Algoriphagus sp. TR-M5]WBL44166.1 glycosyltransferase [Algoriphagus sp. TR-M9]